MRHSRIHQKACLLDALIDAYRRARHMTNFPHKMVGVAMPLIFRDTSWTGRGAFKSVWKVFSPAKTFVLKVSRSKHIRRDLRVYTRLPEKIRNRYYGKIYWNTKYCLLQKHGKRSKIPNDVLTRLRTVGAEFGLTDIRSENIRKIDGRFKIVDANLKKHR